MSDVSTPLVCKSRWRFLVLWERCSFRQAYTVAALQRMQTISSQFCWFIDIDECSVSNGECDTNAVCLNTPGSRDCVCTSGYSGTGITCTGKFTAPPTLFTCSRVRNRLDVVFLALRCRYDCLLLTSTSHRVTQHLTDKWSVRWNCSTRKPLLSYSSRSQCSGCLFCRSRMWGVLFSTETFIDLFSRLAHFTLLMLSLSR